MSRKKDLLMIRERLIRLEKAAQELATDLDEYRETHRYWHHEPVWKELYRRHNRVLKELSNYQREHQAELDELEVLLLSEKQFEGRLSSCFEGPLVGLGVPIVAFSLGFYYLLGLPATILFLGIVGLGVVVVLAMIWIVKASS